MAFTEHEKTRIRHFLSYPSFSSLSQSIQLGYPAASQPLFLLEDAFKRITPDWQTTDRQDLCECESIERQLSASRTRFKASQVGTVKVNGDEPDQLRRELKFWSARLASDMGVNPNPYSQFEYQD